MQREPEQLRDDEVYELDRRAWNLPRPRPQLGTAPAESSSSDDFVGHGAHSNREAESAA